MISYPISIAPNTSSFHPFFGRRRRRKRRRRVPRKVSMTHIDIRKHLVKRKSPIAVVPRIRNKKLVTQRRPGIVRKPSLPPIIMKPTIKRQDNAVIPYRKKPLKIAPVKNRVSNTRKPPIKKQLVKRPKKTANTKALLNNVNKNPLQIESLMKNTLPQTPNEPPKKNHMIRNVIGVSIVLLGITGFIVYKMKTKQQAHGRTR